MRGEGRVFQPKGKNFWMLAYCGPKPNGSWGEIRESSQTDDEGKARKLLEKRVRAVRNHRDGTQQFDGPRAQRVTVGELLDALESYLRKKERKSLYETLCRLRHVREFFGHLRAAQVGTRTVDRYIETRQKAGRANATINRETELLGQAFRRAVKSKELPSFFVPEITALPEDNARQGFFERSEFEALLPHLPTPVDEIARFGYLCGWRRGEILPLRWEQVDRSAREVRLSTSKSGKPRTLPLDEEDWKLFERRWAAREYQTADGTTALSAYVFHRRGKPVDRKVFGDQWRAACLRANLAGKLFHDLRRTAARDMIRSGVSQTVAMKITGHETDSMFRRYDITAPDDKLDALRRRRVYVEQQDGGNVRAFPRANSDPNSDSDALTR